MHGRTDGQTDRRRASLPSSPSLTRLSASWKRKAAARRRRRRRRRILFVSVGDADKDFVLTPLLPSFLPSFVPPSTASNTHQRGTDCCSYAKVGWAWAGPISFISFLTLRQFSLKPPRLHVVLEDIYRVKFARMRHITRISASHKRVIELADDDRDRLRLLIHLFAAGIPESYLVLELCSPLPARAPRGSASGVWSACVYKYSRCGASSPRPSLARSLAPPLPLNRSLTIAAAVAFLSPPPSLDRGSRLRRRLQSRQPTFASLSPSLSPPPVAAEAAAQSLFRSLPAAVLPAPARRSSCRSSSIPLP